LIVKFRWQNISLPFFSFSYSPLLGSSMQPKRIISTSIRASPRQSVLVHAHIDAQKQLTRSLACSFVRNVASNVNVCLPGHTEINKSAPVTITGRLKEEAPNVLEIFTFTP
ncbi:hypothetical protein ACH5RR_009504, partial [Cinchona calisaya]